MVRLQGSRIGGTKLRQGDFFVHNRRGCIAALESGICNIVDMKMVFEPFDVGQNICTSVAATLDLIDRLRTGVIHYRDCFTLLYSPRQHTLSNTDKKGTHGSDERWLVVAMHVDFGLRLPHHVHSGLRTCRRSKRIH